MLDDDLCAEFTRGVNDYWGGEIPDGWDDAERRAHTPYLSGWFMASMWEVRPGWITDEFGVPIQGEDNY